MIEKRRGLGRGLSALLGEDEGHPPGVRQVPVERLHPGRCQPRRQFDEASLAALADSIAAVGVLQPLLVRADPERGDEFEILAGERRWRAAQRAKLHEVPVIVRAASDREALELALVENLQREDLNPLDEAEGYRRLMAEFAHTQEALAARVGKSRSHVANMLRLLTLPEEVRKMVADGRLTAGHARALVTAADPAALAREAVRYGMSVRQVENAASRIGDEDEADAAPRVPAPRDPNVRALERELEAALGLKVTVDAGAKGGGTLTLRYKSLDQLDGIVARLAGERRDRL